MVVGVKLNALAFCLPNDKTSQLNGRKCGTLIKNKYGAKIYSAGW